MAAMDAIIEFATSVRVTMLCMLWEESCQCCKLWPGRCAGTAGWNVDAADGHDSHLDEQQRLQHARP